MASEVEVRDLEQFVAVAEELSFRRAARKLRISQPPLSRRIRRLEEKVGERLFDRSGGRVGLTVAGEAFLGEARAALSRVEDAVQTARRAARGEVGRLALAFEGSSVYDAIPRSLRAFRQRYPGVELLVSEMNTGEQLAALQEGRLEAGFVVGPLRDAGRFGSMTVRREPLIVAVQEGHPLSERREARVEDLAGEPFVMCSSRHGSGLYEEIVGVCRRAGFSPAVAQEVSEIQVILGFVAAGLGVSLLPESVSRFREPGLLYRPLVPSEEVECTLVWKGGEETPVLGAFLEVLEGFAS